MFNEQMFRERLFREGYTKERLAGEIGINQATLYRKINGSSEFTRIEMQIIQKALHLSRDDLCVIFFNDQLTDTQEKRAGR